MTFPIQISNLLPTTTNTQQLSGGKSASDVQKSFSNVLSNAFNQINNAENQANNMEVQLASGKVDNLHNVMISAEKSQIMLSLAVAVRDKAINAYQEIMRMQV
jgi:flagellar hook-basal body complex protein FliE